MALKIELRKRETRLHLRTSTSTEVAIDASVPLEIFPTDDRKRGAEGVAVSTQGGAGYRWILTRARARRRLISKINTGNPVYKRARTVTTGAVQPTLNLIKPCPPRRVSKSTRINDREEALATPVQPTCRVTRL